MPLELRVMSKMIQEDFLYKKVYEFSYATFRIASSAKNKEIAELLESKAVSLLDSVLIADYEKTRNLVYSILTLTGLLVDSGNLHPVNREILIRESEKISLAIEALPMKRKEALPDLNLNKIFSKVVLPKSQIADKNIIQSEIADIRYEKLPISNNKIADEIADKTETRQSAIIEKLQQTENLPAGQAGCRLNELQAIFPEISERTLRYDLESLISKGLVERVGSRRNSFYKITRLPASRTQASGGQENGVGAVIELPGHSTANPGLKQ